jgi:hypothetical protein
VLVLAPIVDTLARRQVRWYSWVALGLSLSALLVTFVSRAGKTATITPGAAIDVLLYIGAYFVRLRFMSRLAKAEDANASKRYFVEEQMIASPALVLALVLAAIFAPEPLSAPLRTGFTGLSLTTGLVVVVIGLLSQGTGIFGGLVLLDKRENSFCVPVNRASSLLAGTAAAFIVWQLWHGARPAGDELIGAALLVAAILVLGLPGVIAKRYGPRV